MSRSCLETGLMGRELAGASRGFEAPLGEELQDRGESAVGISSEYRVLHGEIN